MKMYPILNKMCKFSIESIITYMINDVAKFEENADSIIYALILNYNVLG